MRLPNRRRSPSTCFPRRRSLVGIFTFGLAAAACGAPAGKAAEDPAGADKAAAGPSIGEAAAREGGLSMLGGGASRDRTASTDVFAATKVDGNAIKLDGQVKEWPALKSADVIVEGHGTHAEFGVAYDATRLFVAGVIADAKFVRTSKFGAGEDHASLLLAFPTDKGGYSVHEIGLFPGRPGHSAGSVRFMDGPRKGQTVPNAKIVEMDSGHGVDFEAAMPWTTFPEARLVRVGLRASVRYHDAETSGNVTSIVATSTGDASNPDALAALPLDSEHAVFDGLLVPKGLTATAPRFDLVTDVAGDEMKERVTVYDHWFVIAGPGYRGGKEYFFREIPHDVTKLEARDLTGRKKADLVVSTRRIRGTTTRDAVEVWSVLKGDEPETVFSQDVRLTSANKKVSSALRFGEREIEVSVEPATAWDAATFSEPVESGWDPILLPWGTVRSRLLKFDGSRFALAKEMSQPGIATPGPATAVTREPPLTAPKTPDVKRGGDLSASLLDQYRRDKNVPATEVPRFDASVNVAEDGRPERVVVLGRDLVVFGPGFRGGNQYAVVTMGTFAEPGDVKDVTARDLTGDGAAEVIVRGVVRRKADPGGVLTSDVTFVYSVKEGAPARIFAIETSREVGDKRIQGSVQFVPAAGGRTFDVLAQAGRAFGWTAATYPFPEETSGGAVEPLLLPWGATKMVRYGWTGSAFDKK
ncbi:MAG: hypothetical protein U0169_18955 [Polyangiaceae bacterium]